ncbi:alpha-L-fucosidase [Parapedobacter soli]|uniref:alpha-L-fucosidase n=1 Tax=Parapedobacter soli TaxID=416955 RepID=UPI0021C9DF48|nr:alpha-L-fucosidase [Parapedobacter soli]
MHIGVKSASFALLFIQAALLGCTTGTGHLDNEPAPYGPTPSAAQLNWHELEMYCLIHFTPTTFQNKEWGFGDAPANLFNPVNFDADQIAAAAKSAGFNGLVSVAKHHDGYCLWPTTTTDYNISNSPWRGGEGDMVKEFEEATRKQGMQFGVYVSAWDRNYPDYGSEVYADAYREQLRELYSGYGALFISWHDGANGGDGYYGGANETRKIDRTTYYEWEGKTWPITRQMQPTAVIFSDIGPDVRWVGNESGVAPETSWSTFTPVGPDGGKAGVGHVDLRFQESGQRDGNFWIPAECDVPLRPGWFYHPEQDQQVKTPDELFNLYLQSVGRGGAFNLGLAPMPEGILHPNDVAALKGFSNKVKQTFATNLAEGAGFAASNIRDGQSRHFGPENLLDDDRYSYWATDDGVTSPELVIDLKGEPTFDIIRLRENIKLGQRLDSVWVDVWAEETWQPLASATSIGSSRLIQLDEPIRASRLRLRLFAPVAVALSDFGLFKEAEVVHETVQAERNVLDRSAWTLVSSGVQGGDPARAMDGDETTFWLTDETDLPAEIIIDLGATQAVTGFSYLPRQDGGKEGLVSRYVLAYSTDGSDWQQASEGEFSNIAANPIAQEIRLDQPVLARYLRLTAVALAGADGGPSVISIAEFDVFGN